MSVRVLAFTGGMGSGKSTAVGMTLALLHKRSVILKFAEPLYRIQRSVYDIVGLEQPRPKDRKLLQWIGTDWGREISPTLWVDIWTKQAREYLAEGYFVLTDDLRYDNEAERVHDLGGRIVKVETSDAFREARCNKWSSAEHKSEAGIDPDYFDFKIENNGSLYDLERQLRELLGWL